MVMVMVMAMARIGVRAPSMSFSLSLSRWVSLSFGRSVVRSVQLCPSPGQSHRVQPPVAHDCDGGAARMAPAGGKGAPSFAHRFSRGAG
jgi:hypothetical protein